MESQETRSLPNFLALLGLWQNNPSRLAQYSFLVASNFQTLCILLWSRYTLMTVPIHDNLSSIIQKFLCFEAISNVFDDEASTSIAAALLIFKLLYFVILSLAICFIFLHFFFGYRRHLSNQFRLFMTYLAQFHLTFGFWFTAVILFSTLQDSSIQRLLTDKLNIPVALVITCESILILFSYILGFFFAIFSYDPFISSNVLSCHSPSFQVLTFVFKATAAPVLTLLDDETYKGWLFVGFSNFILLIRHLNLFKAFPFYEYNTMKLAVMLNSICLVTSICNLACMIFLEIDPFNIKDTIHVEIILMLINLKFWFHYFEKIVLVNLVRPNKDLNTEQSVLKKLFCLNHLMRNARTSAVGSKLLDLNEIHFWGIAVAYNKELKKSPDLSNVSKDFGFEMFDNLTMKELRSCCSNFKEQIIHNLLEESVGKLKHCNKLKILLVSLFVKSQESLPITLFYLVSLFKARGIDRFIASKLHTEVRKHIKALFTDDQEKLLDIQAHLDFETMSEKLPRLIHSICLKQQEFWIAFENTDIRIQDLYEKCKTIEEEHDYIESFWTNYIEPNKMFLDSLVTLYTLYLSLVRNRPSLAAKTLKKKIRTKFQEDYTESIFRAEEIINDVNTLTFHASMAKEKLGSIMYVSSHISEALGWGRQDLIGKNINSIMPLFLREGHGLVLEKYLENIGKPISTTRLQKIIETYLIDRTGYILPCQVYVSLHPDIQNELVYIAIVRVKKITEDYLLMSDDGYISGSTRSISESLELVMNNKLHIQDICVNYSAFQKAITSNNRDLATTRQTPMRKFEKSVFSARHSTKLNLDINADSPVNNLRSTLDLKLEFINDRALKKNQIAQSLQYNVELKREAIFNFSFYKLKLTKRNMSKRGCTVIIPKTVRENTGHLPTVEHLTEERTTTRALPTRMQQLNSLESESNKKLIDIVSSRRSVAKLSYKKTKTIFTKYLDEMEHGEKISISDESEPAKEQERNNHKNLQDLINMLDKSRDDDASLTSVETYNTKVEQAIHVIPKDLRLKNVGVLVIILIIISRIFLIYFHVENNKILSLLDNNIEILSQTTKMLTHIIDINKGVRYMLLADLQLMTPARYEVSLVTNKLTDIKSLLVSQMKMFASMTNVLNNNIKRSLYKIDLDLQDQLFQNRVPVYECDNPNTNKAIRKAQIFDLTTEIVAKTISLINNPVSNFSLDNSNYCFILNNTFNDYLIAGQQIVPTLIQDSNLKLESQITQITVNLISMGLMSIFLCFGLYRIIKKFRKIRNHFINIFIRLENDYLLDHRILIKKFAMLLEKNNFSAKGLETKITKQSFYLPIYNQENSKFQKKSVNMKGVNNSLIRISLYTLFYIASLLVIYFVILVIANIQTNVISRKINLMEESNRYLYEFALLHSMQYEYIQENKTTAVRNKPITEEYRTTFNGLTKANDFFLTTLLDKDKGLASNSELNEVIMGNICNKIQTGNGLTDAQCPLIRGGVLKKGLLSLNNLFLSLIQSTITSFDDSAGLFPDMFNDLNSPDIVLEEILYRLYFHEVYALIDDLIQHDLRESLDTFRLLFEALVITYGILGLISGIVSWNKIRRNLENEIIQWSKMIRQIPLEITINNKLLRNYLKRSGREILI